MSKAKTFLIKGPKTKIHRECGFATQMELILKHKIVLNSFKAMMTQTSITIIYPQKFKKYYFTLVNILINIRGVYWQY